MNRLIIIAFAFFSANTLSFGQRISYLSNDYYNLNSIGLVHSEYDTISNGLYPKYYEIYSEVVNEIFSEDIKEIENLDEILLTEPLDTFKIKSLCETNNLDAILVSKNYFLSRDFVYKGFLGLKKIYNPKIMQQGQYCFYVDIKILDKKGELILNSTALTLYGYNAKRSLRNGIKRALKKAKRVK